MRMLMLAQLIFATILFALRHLTGACVVVVRGEVYTLRVSFLSTIRTSRAPRDLCVLVASMSCEHCYMTCVNMHLVHPCNYFDCRSRSFLVSQYGSVLHAYKLNYSECMFSIVECVSDADCCGSCDMEDFVGTCNNQRFRAHQHAHINLH